MTIFFTFCMLKYALFKQEGKKNKNNERKFIIMYLE